MITIEKDNKDWIEMSSLSLEHAAFWMAFGEDPLEHEFRCSQDANYESHFYDHPDGEGMVCKKIEILKSAIRAELIGLAVGQLKLNDSKNDQTVYILKSDWIVWLRKNNYSDLADLVSFKVNTTVQTDAVIASNTQELINLNGSKLISHNVNSKHKIKNRVSALDAVITEAKTKALKPDDYQSVWAMLVKLAESNDRPPPLTGYAEREGVLYSTENNPCKNLTKNALRTRMERASKLLVNDH